MLHSMLSLGQTLSCKETTEGWLRMSRRVSCALRVWHVMMGDVNLGQTLVWLVMGGIECCRCQGLCIHRMKAYPLGIETLFHF